jgi:hypothetical protein
MTNIEDRQLSVHELNTVAGGLPSLREIRAFWTQLSNVFLGPVIGTSIGGNVTGGESA